MLTQPISSPPGPAGVPSGAAVVSATSARAQSASSQPSRPSRLRALSYLRNYTHNHLSRDNSHTHSQTSSGNPGLRPSHNLTRSVSYTPGSSSTPQSQPPRQQSDEDSGSDLALVDSAPMRAPARTSSVPVTPSTGASSATVVTGPNDAAAMGRPRATSASEGSTAPANSTADNRPSIRFSAYFDPRNNRPSLTFPPITRTLPTGTESIRVGRYSERDGQAMANASPSQPSAAPVGFKSKVVSRRHCEFWHENGKWYIKDVKSSSGTFLNHIRLSPPSQESKAYPVNDGDIVQLGIDFKGGEEMIFRCVKMRLELNRGWQNKLNTFNMAAHKRLRTMAAGPAAAAAGSNTDCSICLNSIAPCQSLFVAPCSHTWHFKCVKSLLISPNYPVFICPNCRAGADLEADVDEPTDWDPAGESEEHESEEKPSMFEGKTPHVPDQTLLPDADAADATITIGTHDAPVRPPLPHTASAPLPIRSAPSPGTVPMPSRIPNHTGRTPSPPGQGVEGPITPRNDAGPWVFDGSAGTRAADANASEPGAMASLNAAADMGVQDSPTTGETGHQE